MLLMACQLLDVGGALGFEADPFELGLPEPLDPRGLGPSALLLLELPDPASFLLGVTLRVFDRPLSGLDGVPPRPFGGSCGRFMCDALLFDGHQFP